MPRPDTSGHWWVDFGGRGRCLRNHHRLLIVRQELPKMKHRDDAAAIGAEIEGVPVIATGKAPGLFLLGPLDI